MKVGIYVLQRHESQRTRLSFRLAPVGFILLSIVVGLVAIFVIKDKDYKVIFVNYHALITCLAYALGRQACFISADGCYGIPTNHPFGMRFTYGEMPTILPVHPTPLYESIVHLLIFILLFKMRKSKSLLPSSIFLILTGTSRFFIEFIRRNPKMYFDLSMAQLISIVVISVGLIIFYISINKKKLLTMKKIKLISLIVFMSLFITGIKAQVFVNDAFTLNPPVETYTNYYWDFGDGTTLSTSDTEVTHTYTAAGNFQVSLISEYYCAEDSIIKYDTLINTILAEINFNDLMTYGPNPYVDNCNINYTLPYDCIIHLYVTDASGNIVQELANEMQIAGDYSYSFRAQNLGYPSGAYIMEWEVDGQLYFYQLTELP